MNYEKSNSETLREEATGQRIPRIQTYSQFVGDFRPPSYAIGGVLQKHFLYAITADTGKGKTAVCLTIAGFVVTGRKLLGRKVAQGRVMYFAGENPYDVKMRLIALADEMRIEADILEKNLHVVEGTFSISEMGKYIQAQTEEIGEFALVIVDTSAAYFREEFDDENSNTQAGKHVGNLREMMMSIPGQPTMIVCCHPVKKAAEDNLLPRGGGAALAEYDGNLTCHLINDVVRVHWLGKFRGPDFAPLHFRLQQVTNDKLRDEDGELLPTVFALPMTDEEHKEAVQSHGTEADQVLRVLAEDGGMSQGDIATKLGWVYGDEEPVPPTRSRSTGSSNN
jgi:AAA domain